MISHAKASLADRRENHSPARLEPILKAQGIGVRYGSRYACKDIDLALTSNRIHAIVGPSGCGKSSFLTSINRINSHYPGCHVEGELTYCGQNLLSPNADLVGIRRKIGCIFQTPSPFPFSVTKNFTIPLKAHGIGNKTEQAERMEHYLKLVGLWNEISTRLKQPATQLSGGQQQRLVIARTLALDPELILMDEPCSALDPISTRRIEELLLELTSQYTFIVVTHNLAQARRISDTTTVFWQHDNCGCLLEHGTTQDIFSQPRETLTKSYIQGFHG